MYNSAIRIPYPKYPTHYKAYVTNLHDFCNYGCSKGIREANVFADHNDFVSFFILVQISHHNCLFPISVGSHRT